MSIELPYMRLLPEAHNIIPVWLPHISKPMPKFGSVDELAAASVSMADLVPIGEKTYLMKSLVGGAPYMARYSLLNGAPVFLRGREIPHD